MGDLPLLRFVSEQYPGANFERVLLIACQHILETNIDFFEELFGKGLKPENVFLLGKCYSTNQGTFDRFKKLGVNISELSLAFDSYTSFDEQFGQNVDTFFKNVQSRVDFNSFEKVLILDDGGFLLSHANNVLKEARNVVGIEQTSSGYEKIKGATLRFPVMNIARSRAKLETESPLIAEIAIHKLEQYFVQYDVQAPKILVIGNGMIGQAISALLKTKYVVSGCDVIADRCDFRGNYRERLGEFNVIIGATGTPVIGPDDFVLLKKGALLVSVSSSDREFSAVALRKLVPKSDNCHADIQVGGISLLNSGFPINFNDGAGHSVAPEKIQFTRSLLLAGIFEALAGQFENGLIDLDDAVQVDIEQKFISLNARAL